MRSISHANFFGEKTKANKKIRPKIMYTSIFSSAVQIDQKDLETCDQKHIVENKYSFLLGDGVLEVGI